MAQTATQRRRGVTKAKPKAAGTAGRTAQVKPTAAQATRRVEKTAKPRTGGVARRIAKTAKPKAAGAARRAADAAKPSGVPGPSRLGSAIARKAMKAMLRGAVRAGAAAVRSAVDGAARGGRSAIERGMSRRLPIQVSIDVAVPLEVAWDEWMSFESMTEGVHRIEDVERDDDYLYGHTAGPRSQEWEAEVVDERPYDGFAWRSLKGSDCAGLVTFHRLSERLTRIELDLDVLPTNPAETFALALHLAHRRAESELRRFKARVEFINPDVYEASENGSEPEADVDQEPDVDEEAGIGEQADIDEEDEIDEAQDDEAA